MSITAENSGLCNTPGAKGKLYKAAEKNKYMAQHFPWIHYSAYRLKAGVALER